MKKNVLSPKYLEKRPSLSPSYGRAHKYIGAHS